MLVVFLHNECLNGFKNGGGSTISEPRRGGGVPPKCRASFVFLLDLFVFLIKIKGLIKQIYFFIKSIDFYVEWVYTLHNS